MGTVSAGGSIGPVYVPDAKALQKLEGYPETIHVDDLGEFGFHQSVINDLRVHQMLVSNAQVRAWIERGIPGGCVGAFADMPGEQHSHRGPIGPCGPSITASKSALPWYVEHLMRQQRRQKRTV
jgi:hypothetical protein